MDANGTLMDSGSDDELCSELGYDVAGAAFEVHNELGGGLLEAIYQEAMERELTSVKIPFSAQQEVPVFYKGQQLLKRYIPDLMIDSRMIVELKAIREILPEHQAQTLNYMRITKIRVGYLINFGPTTKLQWERFVL
jgi:GxxExxY protein